jgi:transmembrane sensor
MNGINKNIVTLIVKTIVSELNNIEKEKLESWINADENNRHLFNEIMNSTNLEKWINQKNAEPYKALVYVNTAIQKQKEWSIIRKIIRVAAVLLLPLVIGGSIYFFISKPSEKILTQTEIEPGTRHAILLLDDGKSVFLDNGNETVIREKDGSLIKKSESKLEYLAQDEIKSDITLYNTMRVPRGAEYDLVLSDGTKVYLNSMSEFKYPVHFKNNIRQVELIGEGYFEVARSDTPFIVKTQLLDIKVLGTSFNVNTYKNTGKTITTLVEGSVKVISTSNPETTHDLLPSEQAIFHQDDGKIKIEKVDVSIYTSWKDGELTFNDTRLEDIMTILTRWYSADVLFLDPSVKEIRFSGSLNKYENVNNILEIIESTKKVKIDIIGSEIRLNKRI